ncbi:hypothetical protein ONE63_001128 [Megalurothrips usitatus]|uniref:C2H2-type domain-containing protein n=1 Tax=Megalurothrips usitatus TaxID=439358 RepID=A0AAV7XB47_9NEOP|nr:hypothetical protein ONE63_001128 [Megalurothrips usitatus]
MKDDVIHSPSLATLSGPAPSKLSQPDYATDVGLLSSSTTDTFECTECKKYLLSANLLSHLRMHITERVRRPMPHESYHVQRYKCPSCPKTFLLYLSLMRHMSAHRFA